MCGHSCPLTCPPSCQPVPPSGTGTARHSAAHHLLNSASGSPPRSTARQPPNAQTQANTKWASNTARSGGGGAARRGGRRRLQPGKIWTGGWGEGEGVGGSRGWPGSQEAGSHPTTRHHQKPAAHVARGQPACEGAAHQPRQRGHLVDRGQGDGWAERLARMLKGALHVPERGVGEVGRRGRGARWGNGLGVPMQSEPTKDTPHLAIRAATGPRRLAGRLATHESTIWWERGCGGCVESACVRLRDAL